MRSEHHKGIPPLSIYCPIQEVWDNFWQVLFWTQIRGLYWRNCIWQPFGRLTNCLVHVANFPASTGNWVRRGESPLGDFIRLILDLACVFIGSAQQWALTTNTVYKSSLIARAFYHLSLSGGQDEPLKSIFSAGYFKGTWFPQRSKGVGSPFPQKQASVQ